MTVASATSNDNMDAVVEKMRQGIRSRALDLLARCEASSSSKSGRERRTTTTSCCPTASTSFSTAATSTASSFNDSENSDSSDSDFCSSSSSSSSSNNNISSSSRPFADDDDSDFGLATSTTAATAAASERPRLATNNQDEADRVLAAQGDPNQRHLTSDHTFEGLGLPRHLVEAAYGDPLLKFSKPSEVQARSIPPILAGRDVVAQAPSGSGKTAAFALGMLARIDDGTALSSAATATTATLRGLIVAPTRELAVQIAERAVRPLSSGMPNLRVHLAVSSSSSRTTGAATTTAAAKKKSKKKQLEPIDAHVVVGTVSFRMQRLDISSVYLPLTSSAVSPSKTITSPVRS